ncbi:acid-shock protein [Providencia sp. Me31A]|uniref:acid-shock protein n=1 Tax=Providencia sp. Me31A TaxID=3392637 RepID=UPI003D2CC625
MKKLLAIATVLSLAVSGAALANTTVKTEPIKHIVKVHHAAKNHHANKLKAEKKEGKSKIEDTNKAI